jgi:hypothetical protein
MRAVPLNEGEVGEQSYCFMCNGPYEELYSLTPEDNEEWDKLETVSLFQIITNTG